MLVSRQHEDPWINGRNVEMFEMHEGIEMHKSMEKRQEKKPISISQSHFNIEVWILIYIYENRQRE